MLNEPDATGRSYVRVGETSSKMLRSEKASRLTPKMSPDHALTRGIMGIGVAQVKPMEVASLVNGDRVGVVFGLCAKLRAGIESALARVADGGPPNVK